MTRSRTTRRAVGALAIFALVAFHAVSAWATTCGDCEMADMGCCPDKSDEAPASDELNRASCCEVTPLEAMAALSELTPASFESASVDQIAVAALSVDPIDVQAPPTRVDQPHVFQRALAPPPTRTTVLLL